MTIPYRAFGLMYHDIVDSNGNTGFLIPTADPYRVDLGKFRAHLAAIGKGPARPVTVFECLHGQEPGHLLITFDDGSRSAMLAAEELEKYGWKGHFFVTTGLIGKPGFLSENDILDLHKRGHIIGSHSHTHPNICYNLSINEMFREWQQSCEILAEIIGEPVLTASVPGGDMNRNTIATAAAVGIKFLFTSEPTPRPWQDSGITCYGRVCVKRNTSLSTIERLVRFRGFGRKIVIRRYKQFIKMVIAPIYRYLVPKQLTWTREIRAARWDDITVVARIHKARLSSTDYALGRYSISLIRSFYEAFLGRCVFLLHVSERGIDGFVVGGDSEMISDAKRSFARNHFVRCILETVLHPSLWWTAIRTFVKLYQPPSTALLPILLPKHPNMLFIAVDKAAEGCGAAVALVKAFDSNISSRCAGYTFSVPKTNLRAVRFCEKLGMETIVNTLSEDLVLLREFESPRDGGPRPVKGRNPEDVS